jgi:hypothetical protein
MVYNNNQAFYFQASWDRFEINYMSQKKRQNKSEKEGGKTISNKKPNQKKRNGHKTLSQKNEKGWKKT